MTINLDHLEILIISIVTSVLCTYYLQWRVDRVPRVKLPKARVLK